MLGKAAVLGILVILFIPFSLSETPVNEASVSEDIMIRLYASGLFGVTMEVENTGINTLTNLPWNIEYKTAIEGRGLILNEKSQNGVISSLASGEIQTLSFTPFNAEMTSPIGFGNIYLNASVGTDTLARDQHRTSLMLIFMGSFQDTYIDIAPKGAYEMMQNESFDVIIDVSPIYDDGHLPGAVNYYIGDGTLDDAIPSFDKDLSYLVYCHVDTASVPGAQKLVDAGIENVYRLEGNFQAWVDAGYPIE